MAEKGKSSATRVAVIGLVGTALTVYGGLTGAIVSGVITIYRVEREAQKVALASSESDQVLSVDAGTILISRQQAAALDPETYFVDLDDGLAIRRPLPDWDEMEVLTIGEQLAESGATPPPSLLGEQLVYRIRYGEPIEIQYDQQMLINGQLVPEEKLEIVEQLYGPPPWTQPYYSQVTVNVFAKDVVEELGVKGLPDLLLLLVQLSSSRINRLIAEEDSDFVVVQSWATYERVQVAGETGTLTLETWLLLAETESAYYTVEIVYTPQSGHSVRVWDDLQIYMDSFRVVQ